MNLSDLESSAERDEVIVLKEIYQALSLLGDGRKQVQREVQVLQKAQALLYDAEKHSEKVDHTLQNIFRWVSTYPRLLSEFKKIDLKERVFARDLSIAANNHLGVMILYAERGKLTADNARTGVSTVIGMLNKLVRQMKTVYAVQRKIGAFLRKR